MKLKILSCEPSVSSNLCSINIEDHWSGDDHNKYNNEKILILWEFPKYYTQMWCEQMLLENWCQRLASWRFATELWFVK